MDYEIGYESISKMLDIIGDILEGKSIHKKISDLVEDKDYQVEFSRYVDRVTKEDFINYITNIKDLNEDNIENMDLKSHHSYYKDLLENFDVYKEKLKELQQIVKEDVFEKQMQLALAGLPTGYKFDKVR